MPLQTKLRQRAHEGRMGFGDLEAGVAGRIG